MQDNVRADQIYFWGQELAIHSAIRCISEGKNGVAITTDTIGQAVNEVIRLPLLVPQDRNYAQMIEQVIRNRIDRRLQVDMDI